MATSDVGDDTRNEAKTIGFRCFSKIGIDLDYLLYLSAESPDARHTTCRTKGAIQFPCRTVSRQKRL